MSPNRFDSRCYKCNCVVRAGDGKIVSMKTGYKISHNDGGCKGVYSPSYAGWASYDDMHHSDVAPDLGDK